MPEVTTESTQPQDRSADPKQLTKKQIFIFVGLAIVLAGGFLFYNLSNLSQKPLFPLPTPFVSKPAQTEFELKQFNSAEEFRQYITENSGDVGIGGFASMRSMESLAVPEAAPTVGIVKDIAQNAAAQPDRVSTTNVQVVGIDEPDILKTNGKHLFLSTQQWWYDPGFLPAMEREKVMMEGTTSESAGSPVTVTAPAPAIDPMPAPDMRIAPGYPVVQERPKTQVLTAFPPADLAKLAQIDTTGELLLSGNTLIVLGQLNGQGVLTGFDVSQPANPVQKWQMKLQDNNQLLASRLKDGKLYTVTQKYLNTSSPCPYIPLIQASGQQLTIPCTDIYYPSVPTSNIDTTYTTFIIDPASGAIQHTTSLVGSSNNSVIYMSPTAVYIAYRSQADMVDFFYQFLSAKGTDLFPSTVTEKLAKLRDYDISKQAKMVELQSILEGYQRTLSDDDRLRQQNELQNRMQDFLNERSRDLEDTLLVKLDAENLDTLATGSVPGYLLNQFSLDEYEGNLRVATTFGQTWTQFGQANSASDVYILDENLKQRGMVTDLGTGERIYAVRFIADKGYVVTFKQIDPFYILDLRNPDRPEKTGELKIPGYSSYLHPISATRIVGIGKEDNQVKISLFDVSDVNNPKEVSKYLLNEYWSEILSTHHAFLLDEKHNVFFMPGSQGGYVFSYANDELKLAKAVSQDQVQRAVFVNDYLYMVSQRQVTVLNENDWQVVKELDL